ncbi:hypothetical protein Avbf_10061 [Armadillidium vulgare]|nr:hypothetical protein Avbf_17420 [Armadillidium vulgare]RXG67416.1 hypothetical protein Avbf_10061 [Armadillidium vulgare]
MRAKGNSLAFPDEDKDIDTGGEYGENSFPHGGSATFSSGFQGLYHREGHTFGSPANISPPLTPNNNSHSGSTSGLKCDDNLKSNYQHHQLLQQNQRNPYLTFVKESSSSESPPPLPQLMFDSDVKHFSSTIYDSGLLGSTFSDIEYKRIVNLGCIAFIINRYKFPNQYLSI